MRWVFIYYSPFSVCGDVDVVDDNNLVDDDAFDDGDDTDTPE